MPPPWVVLLLALLNATIALGAMYLAAGRAEAATASVLASGQPLALAAAGWLLFGERGSRLSVAGLALGLAGVVLVATAISGSTTPDGVALALLASAAPTGGTLLMRRLWSRVDLLATTGLQFVVGGVILVATSAILEPWSAVPGPRPLLPSLVVLGVLGTGLAYVAWFWLLGRLSLVVLGSALFLVPVTGVAVAIAVGDRPSPAGADRDGGSPGGHRAGGGRPCYATLRSARGRDCMTAGRRTGSPSRAAECAPPRRPGTVRRCQRHGCAMDP